MTSATSDKQLGSGPENASGPGRGNGRMILLLIAGIPVTVILASTWLWYFVVKGDLDVVGALGTANQGELVRPPRNLAAEEAQDSQGAALAFPAVNPKWTLLVPQRGAECAAECERRLYLTRQIHIAMGKEMARIRRAFIADTPSPRVALSVPTLSDGETAPDSFSGYLRAEHPGLTTVTADSETMQRLFPELESAPETWYVVDPAGWIMMSYSPDISYKSVISDLKFLLKNSNG